MKVSTGLLLFGGEDNHHLLSLGGIEFNTLSPQGGKKKVNMISLLLGAVRREVYPTPRGESDNHSFPSGEE